ncbi:MAG: exonuclease SbcCD subunit D [Lachnospirales bacterium]
MRFLHTSDLHIGKRIGKFSLEDLHKEFFEYLVKVCDEKDVQVLFIAGDVFNVPSPDFISERIFYEGINNLACDGKRIVIISAGNHDSSKKIDVASSLCLDKGIIFIPTISSVVNNGDAIQFKNFKLFNIQEGAFKIQIEDEILSVINLGCPTEENINFYKNNYEKVKLAENYQDRIKEILETKKDFFKKDTLNFFMGHIYLNGTFELSESETNYNIGGLYSVNSKSVPENYDYIALGHLHKKQKVKSVENAYYSGSPISFSKSEANHKKYIIYGEIDKNKKMNLEEIEVNLSKKTFYKSFKETDEIIKYISENNFENTYVYFELCDEKFFNPKYNENNEKLINLLNDMEFLVDFEAKKEEAEIIKEEYSEDFEIYEVFKKLALNQFQDIEEERVLKLFDLYNNMLNIESRG